jgi:Outer membrane protein beta-barrel domain
MRTLVAAVALVAVICSSAIAQFRKGDTELSFNLGLGSRSMKVSGHGYEDSESYNFMYLGVSPGFFLAQGISVEPEIAFMAMEKQLPTWYFLLNICYTHALEGTKVAPFARAGIGIANGIPALPGTLTVFRVSDQLDVLVLNVGGGVKYQIAGAAYLRAEANYKRYSWSRALSSGSTSSTDYSDGDFGILVGLSVLLGG